VLISEIGARMVYSLPRQEQKGLFMKAAFRMMIAAFLLALPVLILVQAAWADTTPEPTSKPSPAPDPKTVLATVGDTNIIAGQVEDVLVIHKEVPADKKDEARKVILSNLIQETAMHKYLQKEKVQCMPEEEAAFTKEQIAPAAEQAKMPVEQFLKERGLTKEFIHDRTCLEKVMKEAASKEKAEAFVKDNPDYFNGTQVRASHILILCSEFASTQAQQDAVKKLEQIAADIKAGKISFEDAAKKVSECPSKEKGGDLDFFTYEKMVPSFAVAAFATKKGDMTVVVRSKFGFHLIKVTDRKDGKEQASPEAQQIARSALQFRVVDKIVSMAMTDCKIVIK
jgi:parvulin-like peptidyl-prolyl isomerase